MTIEEIFATIAKKMIEGLMFHSQLCDYFQFLGFDGYAECQKYHFFEESCNYKKLGYYYLHHFDKLVMESKFDDPKVIPDNWIKYTREDVNSNARKAGIQTGFDRWISWEKSVKETYELMYQELISLGEIAAAAELKKYIKDVDYELAKAAQKRVELKTTDWNISDIINEQENYIKKYKKKLQEIELC